MPAMDVASWVEPSSEVAKSMNQFIAVYPNPIRKKGRKPATNSRAIASNTKPPRGLL